jgi:single-stranded-DNA-specific exonuclease
MLTVGNVEKLSQLEPCGNGCPKPLLVCREMTVDRLAPVGGGRHVRMRLHTGRNTLQGIWFSAAAELAALTPGDTVDVAFYPQINEFKGERSVQMNVQDIRPSCRAEVTMDTAKYHSLRHAEVDAATAEALLPDRATLALVWRYLAEAPNGVWKESPACLCRKLVRRTGMPMDLGKLLTCLDIFADVGLLEIQRFHKYIVIQLTPSGEKADLMSSRTMQILLAAKG